MQKTGRAPSWMETGLWRIPPQVCECVSVGGVSGGRWHVVGVCVSIAYAYKQFGTCFALGNVPVAIKSSVVINSVSY